MMKRMLLVAAVVMISACAPMQTKRVARIPYDASYFANPSHEKGAVEGQLFLRTRGGDVKKGAGEVVQLNPVNPMSEQWYQVEYLANQRLSDVDERYKPHVISVQADGDGKFTFTGVPVGDYFLVGKVTWDIPYGMTQGDIIAKRVTVKSGETQSVMLTK